MLERFSTWGRQVVVHAQEEARSMRHNWVGTEHLLIALLRDPDQVSGRVLRGLGMSADDVRERVRSELPASESPTSGQIPFTPHAKRTLELAAREALSLGHDQVGTEHVLLGLVREGEGLAATLLAEAGVNPHRVRDDVMSALSDGGAPPEPERAPQRFERDPAAGAGEAIARFASPWDTAVQAHLLIALASGEGRVAEWLREHGVTPEAVRQQISGD